MELIGNSLPIELELTYDFLTDETESLLGFIPNNGEQVHTFYSFPYRRCFYDIERIFGTFILNTLGEVVNNFNKCKLVRPNFMWVMSIGDTKKGFTMKFTFMVLVECSNKGLDCGNVKKALIAACPDGCEIK